MHSTQYSEKSTVLHKNSKEGDGKVAAAVLAYSRLDTLKQVVNSLKKQTRTPDEIIVVFQGSDEAIWTWLTDQQGLVLERQANAGSAGGFSRCITLSMDRGNDWTWIIDDDAIPDVRALERLTNCKYFSSTSVGFLSSRIVDPHGRTYMSPIPVEHNEWYNTVLEDKCVRVTRGTWLGLLVATNAIRKCGLPLKEYFLWDEDQEFTYRIAHSLDSYCVINSVIVHYQGGDFDPRKPSDALKYKYLSRNRIATIRLTEKSSLKRKFRIGIWLCKIVTDVAKGRAPFKAILCANYGIFGFRPEIKYYKKKIEN